ncbi:hypothetical protein [Kitasatospora sp. GAS1066B]|uniref:hypothetical protein n=1 Tax=Kitasatospora sp. GAS1066B TaxID=3156271 RepID=UPI003515465C
MITLSTLERPHQVPPRRPPGTVRIASLDLEWTKNYRIKNGNRPFCYSLTWIDLPSGVLDPAAVMFDWTSLYVESADEMGQLIKQAGTAVQRAFDGADLIVGHQLCADLAVLDAHHDHHRPRSVGPAREAWRRRRTPDAADPAILDTRYDAGHLLTNPSRRLVDVCGELQLDVTQPELRGTSMTALHRRWLEKSDHEACERVSVLNLRHSLSTALVAARARGVSTWREPVNVNRVLAQRAEGAWTWLTSPTFTKLLTEDPCPSATASS